MANNNITLIFNGNIYQSFSRAGLEKIPAWKAAGGPTVYNTELPVTSLHVKLVARVVAGGTIACSEVTSHLDAWAVVRLAQEIGVSTDDLNKSTIAWTTGETWHLLARPDYLYPLFRIAEWMVSWKTYFAKATRPFDAVEMMRVVSVTHLPPAVLVDAFRFYRQYKLSTLFDENTPETRNQLLALKDQRRDALAHTVMDVYRVPAEYYRYTPTSDQVWRFDGVCPRERLAVGAPTLAVHGVFTENLRKFTCGLLEKSPNPDLATAKFPWKNVCIAGGSVEQCLSANYTPQPSSDVDFFLYGKYAETSAALQSLVEWFNSPKTFYAVVGSVLTVYLIGTPRKFQIVCSNAKSVYEVIGRFDLSHIQYAVTQVNDRYTVHATPDAVYSQRDLTSRIMNPHKLRIERFIKALYRGRDVEKIDKMATKYNFDLTPLLENPTSNPTLRRTLQTMRVYYHPAYTVGSDDLAEQHQHMEGMILADSKGSLVTRNPIEAVNSVVLNGNFTTDYESMSFTNFRIESVVNHNAARPRIKTQMRDRNMAIRLVSGDLRVSNIITSDEGIEIIAEILDPLFAEHIRLLETLVFRLYSHNPVTTHIINQDGKIRLFLSRYRLDMQLSRGYTILKSKKGENLNIDEDLVTGDVFRIAYTVDVVSQHERRHMQLAPFKVIKTTDVAPATEALVERNNAEKTSARASRVIAYADDKTPDAEARAQASARITVKRNEYAERAVKRAPVPPPKPKVAPRRDDSESDDE